MRRLVAGAVLALVAVVALAAPASAHAQLETTSPPAGAVLTAAPTEATVRFNEPVQVEPGAVQLHDGSGRRVDVGEVDRADGGRTLRLPLPKLDDGGYVVTWRLLSADGHPVSGGVTWRVGESSAAVDQGLFQNLLNAEGGDATVHSVAAGVRTLLFVALVVLIGGLVFLLAVWPDGAADRRLRRMLWIAAGVGAVTTVAGLGLQGADVGGFGLGHAWLPGTVADTLDTTYGRSGIARFVLLGVLAALTAVATPARVRAWRWQIGTLSAAALCLLTLTLAGHARTGRWISVAVPLDLVHLGAGFTWIGGLAVLTFVVLPRDRDGSAPPVVARFSSVAAVCVLAVVVTGVVQGLRQLGDLESLRTTSYGRLLVIKVVAVAVVVVLGAMSRSLVRRRVDGLVPSGSDDDDGGEEFLPAGPVDVRRTLRRSVGAEAVLAVVVLAVTSLLVTADPSRTVVASGFSASRVVQGTIIEVQAAPARIGPVDVHVFVTDLSAGLTTPLSGTATLALPDRDIPPVQVPLSEAGRGHWSAYDVDIPIRGRWRLDVNVTIGEFEQRRTTFTIPIS